MKSIVESWAYATDDGRFKLSGMTGKPNITISVTEPGSGFGVMKTPEQTVSVEMDFNEFAVIYHAVKAKIVDGSQR